MKKAFRVKKSKEIEAILKHRNKQRSTHFTCYKKENPLNTHYRFAISVPKKFGKAVARNKIKRQVRMIVSQLLFKKGIDIFVVIHQTANTLSFQQIEKEFIQLMQKHNLIEVEQ